MCYGWELVEDKLLEYAEEIGVREYAMYCCNKEELKGRNIDPANILEPPRGRPPGTVGVRVFSPLRTMEELFAVYLDVLDIDTCLINPIRAVYTPEGSTTHIYTFYTNYHCDDAPTKPQLEALRWAMDEYGLSRELKWWFSVEEPHWRDPSDPWPLR